MAAIKKAGGVKPYMNWSGFAITDSGGWQLLSLIYKDKSFGKVTDEGVVFFRGSLGEHKKYLFTPEKSIQVQFDLNPDIIVCLDDCPAKDASKKEIEKAVERTIAWAQRCKTEYSKQIKKRKINSIHRPLLLAPIQGGFDKKLRQKCAKELIKIGFDGYGWGGWTADSKGRLGLEIAQFMVSQLPADKPKFALGVGYPWDIIETTKIGYHIFDTVLPTRDARHKRLYVWTKKPDKINILKTNSRKLFQYFYPDKEKYRQDQKPVDKFCDCQLCQNHSRAYLQHLFKIQDSLAWRLATIHNLRVYTKVIELLRKNVS
jgi:queuine tRNA-ribosyltransferase